MFVVIRPVATDQVAKKVPLSGEVRARLWTRFQQFRNRAGVEAGRMEDVALRKPKLSDGDSWTYEGPWFLLESTADEAMVRRCVVRAGRTTAVTGSCCHPAASIGPGCGC